MVSLVVQGYSKVGVLVALDIIADRIIVSGVRPRASLRGWERATATSSRSSTPFRRTCARHTIVGCHAAWDTVSRGILCQVQPTCAQQALHGIARAACIIQRASLRSRATHSHAADRSARTQPHPTLCRACVRMRADSVCVPVCMRARVQFACVCVYAGMRVVCACVCVRVVCACVFAGTGER